LNPQSQIRVDIPDTLPDLWVDTGLAERVLANLLDNALQHTPPEKWVTVRGSAREDMVACEVIDHGPGVPEHLWTQIFSPFQRFGDRQVGGIGLGLAIARGFTDAMGGHLQPIRTPGGGLTMQLLLPTVTQAGGRT
jgi:two-component system sensor histidine kinase KdpD